MCFVPVEPPEDGTYHHVTKPFIHTITVDKEKLQLIADLLRIPASKAKKWQPGKILIVNDVKKTRHRKKSKKK
jgi:hypothetical protein